MAHLTDPDQGSIFGQGDDANWTWVRIIRLHNRTSVLPICDETSLTIGENILLDPGFEDQVAMLDGSTIIPSRTFDGASFDAQLWHETVGDVIPWQQGIWATQANVGDWTYQNSGADEGTWFARYSGLGGSGFLDCCQYRMCSEVRGGTPPWNPVDTEPWMHAGRVQSGFNIEASFRARTSGTLTNIQSTVEFHRPDGSFQNEADPIFQQWSPPGGTWTTFTHSGTVGGTTEPFWFMSWWIRGNALSGNTITFDLDNMRLTVEE